MKKLTGIFALLCAVSCMTACNSNGTTAANAASDNVQITVVTASSVTTAQTAAATTTTSAALTTAASTVSSAAKTAAATTASSAAKTAAATTVSSVAQTAAATTASSAAKITAAQKNTDNDFTVSGHIWFIVNDIITEYAGKKLDEGIVVYSCFQCWPEVMTLPLDVCSKLEKGGQYIIEFNDTKIPDPTPCMYLWDVDGSMEVACDYFDLLGSYAKLGTLREEREGDQGLDCDIITWKNLPADAKLNEWTGYNDMKPETFTAEFVEGFSDQQSSRDILVLVRDGKPFKLYADITNIPFDQYVPGKQYRFTITKDEYDSPVATAVAVSK
ncbi:MAG: hypothetical protein IK130_05325 [Oscillospiraceae bacterium]|nr:hypothetical protein [Oscillospiraceae bacterium]